MKWIKSSEKLPCENIHRDLNNYFSEDLLCYGEGVYFIAYTFNKEWVYLDNEVNAEIEFWQQLPKSPK